MRKAYGSSFLVTLPLAQQPHPSVVQKVRTHQGGEQQGKQAFLGFVCFRSMEKSF